jgi:hypothetical protein
METVVKKLAPEFESDQCCISLLGAIWYQQAADALGFSDQVRVSRRKAKWGGVFFDITLDEENRQKFFAKVLEIQEKAGL